MKKNNCLYFGTYPQTIKKEDVIIDEEIVYTINNWKCYKGNDNNYYVKEEAHNLNPVTDVFYNKMHFSNGEKIVSGKEYYFKIEPICWLILNQKEDGYSFVISDKALDVTSFDLHIDKDDKAKLRAIDGKNIIPSDYAYSNIRAFLNGLDGSKYDVPNFRNKGFIDKAFNIEERNRIKEEIIDNSEKAIVPLELQDEYLGTYSTDNTFTNTIDKVSLLGFNEAFGFEKSFRIKLPSDYALSKGGFNLGLNTGCWWWLRTPNWNDFIGYERINADYVQDSGDIDIGIRTDLSLCVVPTITIKDEY